jgi:hypothetical protein
MRRTRRPRAALVALALAALATSAGRSGSAQTAPPPEPPPATVAAPETAPATPEALPPPETTPSMPPTANRPPAVVAPPPSPTAPPTASSPPPPPPSNDGRAPDGVARLAPLSASARAPAEDPQADRGVLAPTAYTHPKGTYYVSDYELALVQVGYALTDDTQLSLTGVPPLGAERIVVLDITLKSTLYRGGLVRVAALGSTSGVGGKEIGVFAVGRVGGVVQLCLEDRCGSSLSLSSNMTLAGVMLMVNGASGIFRVGRTMSLLAELDTLVPLGKDAGQINGAMGGGGVRLHWTNWGLDLTLMRVLGASHVTLPILALTYRSVP